MGQSLVGVHARLSIAAVLLHAAAPAAADELFVRGEIVCKDWLSSITTLLSVGQAPQVSGGRSRFCLGGTPVEFSCKPNTDVLKIASDPAASCATMAPKGELSLVEMMGAMTGLVQSLDSKTEIYGPTFTYERCVEIQTLLVGFWAATGKMSHDINAKNEQVFSAGECGEKLTVTCSTSQNALTLMSEKTPDADCKSSNSPLKSLLDSLQ